MGKNRNRIVNRQHQANGLAAAKTAATTAAQESADNLALAVEWICRADFGPSLAYLMAGYYVYLYVSGALKKERERTGGGGDLGKTRAAAKKIAEGKFLEATGNNQSLPDMDVLIKTYSAYSLLSGQQEPSASTCEAPWSGFRDLGRLVYRKNAESEGWAFAEIVDVAKARAVFTDWLLTRPRVKVSELVASVSSLLGLAPKPASKPPATPADPVVPATGEQAATLAPEAPATAPNAVVTPPEGATPAADNPAAPAVAAQEAQPAASDAPEVNPNFAPGGEEDGEEDTEEDAQEDATEQAPRSDLPRPADHAAGENAVKDDGRPYNVASAFLDRLLSFDSVQDMHTAASALGKLLALTPVSGAAIMASLIEGYTDACEDADQLAGISQLTGTKADELTDARQPAVAAVA